MYEFDLGFMVWERRPAPEDPTALPSVVGGTCIVIDRATGQIRHRPLLDPESVAESYRRNFG